VIATSGGIYSAVGGFWTQAALFWGAAVVLATMTVWSYKK
jgi:drug/metabolite transporter superfamily protein YnfA